LAHAFFRFVTNHAFGSKTDRRTDSFLVARPRRMQCMKRGKKTLGAKCGAGTDFTGKNESEKY